MWRCLLACSVAHLPACLPACEQPAAMNRLRKYERQRIIIALNYFLICLFSCLSYLSSHNCRLAVGSVMCAAAVLSWRLLETCCRQAGNENQIKFVGAAAAASRWGGRLTGMSEHKFNIFVSQCHHHFILHSAA